LQARVIIFRGDRHEPVLGLHPPSVCSLLDTGLRKQHRQQPATSIHHYQFNRERAASSVHCDRHLFRATDDGQPAPSLRLGHWTFCAAAEGCAIYVDDPAVRIRLQRSRTLFAGQYSCALGSKRPGHRIITVGEGGYGDGAYSLPVRTAIHAGLTVPNPNPAHPWLAPKCHLIS
jgi:hypothetical protein